MTSLLFIDNANKQHQSAAVQELLSEKLPGLGYELILCDNPKQGFTQYIKHQPDWVLLCADLPAAEIESLANAIGHYHDQAFHAIALLFDEHTDTQAKQNASLQQLLLNPLISDALFLPIDTQQLSLRLALMKKNNDLQQDLHQRLADAQNHLQMAQLGAWQWSLETDSIQADELAFALMNLPAQFSIHKNAFFAHAKDRDKYLFEQAIVDAQHGKKQLDFSFKVVHPKKTLHLECLAEALFNDQRQLVGLKGTLQDISNLHRSDALIDYQSQYDPLTELPNRQHFNELLRQHLAEQPVLSSAVVIIDIDRFYQFNREIGQQQADTLLQTLAQRLSQIIREGDIAARLGNNEFAILATNFNDPDELSLFMERLFANINTPFVIDQQEKLFSYSLGVSVIPMDADKAETALDHANLACSQAKQQGGNRYEFYQAEMKQSAQNVLQLEMDLRRALKRNELELYYQPQVDANTFQPVGCEALIRWNHPQLGVISPSVFIPLAETIGMIDELGEYALSQAIQQTALWHKQGYPLTIGINLSANQFNQHALIPTVQNAIEKTDLPSHFIDLEITETLAMNDANHNISILSGLKALGVKLSIDDFGTGYSSLAYLHRFPVDNLKIDRAFVENLDETTGQSLAKTILAMAQSLQLTVIAEGIETEQQEKFLQDNGCQILQGYKYGKPMQKEAFNDWLNHYNSGFI